MSTVRAEMSATVLRVLVSARDTVESGATLVVLDSMKMEIPVVADRAGTVVLLAVRVGDSLQEGDLIVSLQ